MHLMSQSIIELTNGAKRKLQAVVDSWTHQWYIRPYRKSNVSLMTTCLGAPNFRLNDGCIYLHTKSNIRGLYAALWDYVWTECIHSWNSWFAPPPTQLFWIFTNRLLWNVKSPFK
jgi:hypothetical protein